MSGGKNLETESQETSDQNSEWSAISNYLSSFAENNEELIEIDYGSSPKETTPFLKEEELWEESPAESPEESLSEADEKTMQENIEIMRKEIDNMLDELSQIRNSRSSLQNRLNNLRI